MSWHDPCARMIASEDRQGGHVFSSKPAKYWNQVRTSFWFIPGGMTLGATLAAVGAVALDRAYPDHPLSLPWIGYSGGAEGASEVLGTIAGSMVTIAGVVFSMTLVALSLASRQLGPRLLRNFMRDRTNQVVLGTFIATFLYCLLVLRTILRPDEGDFVPQLAVSMGVLFAIGSVGVLIYFIHHISLSIQADHMVARVGRELIDGIEERFPERLQEQGADGDTGMEADRYGVPSEEAPDGEGHVVRVSRDGYVQSVDTDELCKRATDDDLVMRVEQGPGRFVVAGAPLVTVWPAGPVPDGMPDGLDDGVEGAFILGGSRTPGQDVEFSVEQLVEIAVRALSPGVNDPYTAIRCVDRLGAALSRLARRQIPSPHLRDAEGRLRVIRPVASFPDVADTALDQIRQHSASNPSVTIRLLETLASVARFVHREEDREALLRHANMVARSAREGFVEEEDRKVADERYRVAKRVLARG